jgi:hypothetical protein
MSDRLKAGIAGIVGAIVVFGMAELVHGLYKPVPSVFTSLAQRVVQLTPGQLVTKGIETLGQADIPTLIISLIVGASVVAAILANLAVRSPIGALAAVGILALVAIAATLAEPFVAPTPTVVTVVSALAVGALTTELLLHAAGLRASKPVVAEPASDPRLSPGVRSKEAYSAGGMRVGRSGFLLLSGGATVAGIAALGVGRLLSGRGEQAAAGPKRLKLHESPTKPSGQTAVKHGALPPPSKDASIEVQGMPALITPASSFYLIDTELISPG